MTSPHPTRRAVLVGGALAAVALATGCQPTWTRRSGDLRQRLADALRRDAPARAELVADPRSTLTVVPADWLRGWVIVDVLSHALPHPRRFYAALSDRGRAELLTGDIQALARVMIDAGVRVRSAGIAAAVGAVYLDVDREFDVYAYRIDRVDDIEWLPAPTAAEAARRDALKAAYRDTITPLRAEGGDEEWRVTSWMVEGRELRRHEVNIVSGLPGSDTITPYERDLPVPQSR